MPRKINWTLLLAVAVVATLIIAGTARPGRSTWQIGITVASVRFSLVASSEHVRNRTELSVSEQRGLLRGLAEW